MHSARCRVTSSIRKRHPPRTIVGPQAYSYCRVPGGWAFSYEPGTPVERWRQRDPEAGTSWPTGSWGGGRFLASFTLHTTHYTLRTTHYTLHTSHFTLHTTHNTQHTTRSVSILTSSRRVDVKDVDVRGVARHAHKVYEPYTKSMSLKYEPASEPLHISVKYDLVWVGGRRGRRCACGGTAPLGFRV